MCNDIITLGNRQFDDSFNGEYEVVLKGRGGGPLAPHTERQKRTNELEKIE